MCVGDGCVGWGVGVRKNRSGRDRRQKGRREWNLEGCICVKGMCVCVCVRLVVKVRKMGVVGIRGKEEGFGKLKDLHVRRECVCVCVCAC